MNIPSLWWLTAGLLLGIALGGLLVNNLVARPLERAAQAQHSQLLATKAKLEASELRVSDLVTERDKARTATQETSARLDEAMALSEEQNKMLRMLRPCLR